MIMLLVGIIILATLNLTVGSVNIPANAVFQILNPFSNGLDKGDTNEIWTNIVMQTRLPQTLTAIACGAGLSVAGLEMQTVFRNPLAGPSVLGISSAASLGVAFVVLLNGAIWGGSLIRLGIIGNTAITLAAICGAMLVMAVIVFLSQRVNGNVTLLITGVLIGYIATAIIGVSMRIVEREEPKCIKFATENSPVVANLWIQIVPEGDDACKMRLTIKADINPFIKAMVSKPLQEGIEKMVDVLSMIPYGQIAEW